MGITLLTTFLIFSYLLVPLHAHIFSSDESASFISLADQIKSTLVAISQNNSSSIEAIKEQGKYARTLLNDSIVKEINEKNQRLGTELPRSLDSLQDISQESQVNSNITKILDLLSETISARVERDQLENSTIQALVVAEDVDKIFKDYSTAFNKSATEMDMNMSTNMSMNMSTNTSMTPNSENAMNIPVDMQAYDRAVAFVDVTIDRFNAELKGKSENVTSAQDALIGLEQLRKAMQSKEPPSALLGTIHGQIHPNLQTAYGLELAKTTSDKNSTSHSTQHSTKT
jgi:hypothetical protein